MVKLTDGAYGVTRNGREVGPFWQWGKYYATSEEIDGMRRVWNSDGVHGSDFVPNIEKYDIVALVPGIAPTASSGAMREKLNSTPYDLVPYQEITDAYSRVAEFGAQRYESWNWTKGLPRIQILCSLLRHTFAYLRGQDRDKDSGLLHTDHILWNSVALSHNVHWSLEDGRRVEPEREYKT